MHRSITEAARQARARARRLRARLTARARPGTFSIKFLNAPRVCSKGAKALQAVTSPKQRVPFEDEEDSESAEPLVAKASSTKGKRKEFSPGKEAQA